MRLIFHDLTSPPLSFRCGAVGDTLSGVTSVLSGAYNAKTSSENVSAQLGAQKSENALNRDWQTEEAEKNRQFQQGQTLQAQQFQNEQRLASQQYQSEQWQNQFNQELAHRFDVPSGVNPAVYFSSHGAASGVGGSVSAPSGSAPSPQSGSMPSGVQGLSPVPYQNHRLDVVQMLGAAGSFIENLASAGKQGAETKEILGTLTSKIRTAIANADTAEVVSNLQKLNYELQKGKFPIELKRAAAEYENIVRDGLLTKEKTLSERYNQDLIQATKRLQDAMSNLNDKQSERLGLEMPYVVQYMTSQIQDNVASAQEHRSAVGRNKASERHYISESKLNEFTYEVNRNTQADIEESVRYQTENLQKQGEILGWQADAAQSAAHQAAVAADHAEALFWKDFVIDIISSGVDAFTSVKNSRSWENLSDASQRRVDARLKEIEHQYGDKVEITTTPKGKSKTVTYRRPYQKYGHTTD